MRRCPDYISITADHVVACVEVFVPWRDEGLYYRHAFDMPGLREEFGPLPEVHGPFDLHRRREILDKRHKAVDALAAQIAHSILNALGEDRR